MALQRLGYWTAQVQPVVNRPNYGAHKDAIVAYLANGIRIDCYDGFAHCRVCHVDVGCDDYTDRVWMWPSGFQHYIVEHAIELPQAFVAHVVARNFSYVGLKPVLVVESTLTPGAPTRMEWPPLQNYARYGGPGSTHVVHDNPDGPWFSLVSDNDSLAVWGSHGLSGRELRVGGTLMHQGLRLRLEPPLAR
jgi:hypothetical protein